MDRSVAIYTLGCKVNQAESAGLLEAFREKGWQPVETGNPASVCVINTCTVTKVADHKSAKLIRGTKRRNPGALLVVTGCFAETGKVLLEEMTEIDLVLTNDKKDELPDLVEAAWRRSHEGQDATGDAEHGASAVAGTGTSAVAGTSRTRAMLKLQDGCQQHCSYCIIPYVRKDRYSMPIREAVTRAGALVAQGYREIVLLGIHLGLYGRETGKREQLSLVYETLLDAYPQVRFRLGSVEPTEATGRLPALIRDYPNACKHLHLPLQSGCDRILSLMHRPYTAADYRAVVMEIRGVVPEIALTTDVMTGFPGETEEEHRCSLSFTAEMAFSRLHVFPYSRRPGTPAADMPSQITVADKERRSNDFIRLGLQLQERYGESWLGRPQEVLLEEEFEPGQWIGHSDNYLEVTYTPVYSSKDSSHSSAETPLKGDILPLKIVGKSLLKQEAWEGVALP